ncbi:MAG: FG-GAP repeat protein, partial [Desmonostoc geniculatum HA4340-LM1]|nr:FG-GAP repeat protein [Desmonostoc geniculatum HA4340-LM1]
MNGDGIDDVIIGAIFASPNGQSYAGESYVVFGFQTGATTTFLNDLNNNIAGFYNSNDVINGQGGNDIINGNNGDDLLRGGE